MLSGRESPSISKEFKRLCLGDSVGYQRACMVHRVDSAPNLLTEEGAFSFLISNYTESEIQTGKSHAVVLLLKWKLREFQDLEAL